MDENALAVYQALVTREEFDFGNSAGKIHVQKSITTQLLYFKRFSKKYDAGYIPNFSNPSNSYFLDSDITLYPWS